jgi:hypothetical protein
VNELTKCQCCGTTLFLKDADAIDSWNRRARDPEIKHLRGLAYELLESSARTERQRDELLAALIKVTETARYNVDAEICIPYEVRNAISAAIEKATK